MKNFEAANPGVTVKQVEGLTSGVSAAAAQVSQNRDSYDMALGGPVLGEQLQQGGLLEQVDFANIPNIKYVAAALPRRVPLGHPDRLRQDRHRLPQRPDDRDAHQLGRSVGAGSEVLGQDHLRRLRRGRDRRCAATRATTSTAPTRVELDEAKQALLEIKPHLLAFLPTDVTKPLLKGSAVMTVDYDYDLGRRQPRRTRMSSGCAPTEGMPAYLDGWLAIKGTDKLPEVEAFMNFHLDPKNYADFINTTGSAYVIQDAEQYIKPTIVNNPSLKYDPATVETIEFEKFLGAEATKLRSQIWEEVKAA